MRRNRRYDRGAYKDRYAPDGVVSTGWRYVRKGGRIKAAGTWWHAPELEPLVGEFVHFSVYDYWMEKLMISRGAIGCRGLFCDAFPE